MQTDLQHARAERGERRCLEGLLTRIDYTRAARQRGYVDVAAAFAAALRLA